VTPEPLACRAKSGEVVGERQGLDAHALAFFEQLPARKGSVVGAKGGKGTGSIASYQRGARVVEDRALGSERIDRARCAPVPRGDASKNAPQPRP
jgi:hypothetical protein